MKLSHHKKMVLRNIAFAGLGSIVLIGSSMLIWFSSIRLPDFSSFSDRKEVNSTRIYDRTGEIVLYNLGSNARRTSIPYSDMGENIKSATVAIEDGNFYEHQGVRPKAMIRALWADIRHQGAVQGGSTITQQVIKKSLLSDHKTLVRKFKEIILALKLDRAYSKDEILGIYLNEIPYGGNIYGIDEAARSFLGKSPKDLTVAESAYLASIPNAPTRFSPYGSHKDELEARKNLVLSRMKLLGFINDETYAQAVTEKVAFKEQQKKGSDIIKAPHFVFFIKDYLEQKYGPDIVESGGLKVTTTLDYEMQEIGEKVVATFTTGERKQIAGENSGLVSIDPKTGQILTMVGSRDYFDKEIDGNFNVTTARRQPGSSIKPFMYATAFKKGFTPETVLFDVPTEFNSSCDPYGRPRIAGLPASSCYSPENYDEVFHGPMTVREALARSMNVPAVKMLYLVGVKDTIKTAQDMGITTLTDPDSYGLALVLGGAEVRLLEETSAYGAFATDGIRHPYTGILKVENKDGALLEEWQDNPVEVLPKNIALTISDILSDNAARTPTFGANSPLYIPGRQVASKSGTTNSYKDSWAIGYTPSLVTGVWLGKNDNTSMGKNILASPVWNAFMTEVLKKYPVEYFEKPAPNPEYAKLPAVMRGYWQGSETYLVDTVSGKLATEFTPKETTREYVVTNVHDILHWINKDDPLGGKPENPENDPLYFNFETAVRNWWTVNSYRYPLITHGDIPTETDNIHTEGNAPAISIVSPIEGTVFNPSDTVTVTVSPVSAYPIAKIDIFLNNAYIGTARGSLPFNFSPGVLSSVSGQATITVVATDTIGNSASASTVIVVEN